MSHLAAFMGLGFLLLHTFSMVIAFNALAGDKQFHQLFVPVMHLCASLLVKLLTLFLLLSHILAGFADLLSICYRHCFLTSIDVLNHELVWRWWTYFTSYCFADNGESSPRGLHCRCSNDFDMRCGDHGCGREDCVGQDKHWLCWAWQPTESTLFIKSMNLSLCSAYAPPWPVQPCLQFFWDLVFASKNHMGGDIHWPL